MIHLSIHCSNHDPVDEFGLLIWRLRESFMVIVSCGKFHLTLNCFIVASSRVALPEKYAAIALWNNNSCLCITLIYKRKHFSHRQANFVFGDLPDSHLRTAFSPTRRSSASHMLPYALRSFFAPLHLLVHSPIPSPYDMRRIRFSHFQTVELWWELQEGQY